MTRGPTELLPRPFRFSSSGIELAGLVEPGSGGKSVLLLSGSGPQDRNETIAGHKPFEVLSQALVREGHTVFRWDDRGVGESGGDYQSASAGQLVDDVVAAMRAASRVSGHDKHVLVGHSQGALIAAATAAANPQAVEGIVLLAGMGIAGRAALTSQFRRIGLAEGWPEDELDVALVQRSALFDMLETIDERLAAGEPGVEVERDVRESLLRLLSGGAAPAALSADDLAALQAVVDDLMEWEWRYLLKVDPAENLEQVTCPVLAITGENDLQVDAVTDIEAIRTACSRASSLETHVLPEHNHLLQQTASGVLSDYAELGTPFTDLSVKPLTDWLRRL